MILPTAAASRTQKTVLSHLIHAGAKVRAFGRDPASRNLAALSA
jgi:hypothetical protein